MKVLLVDGPGSTRLDQFMNDLQKERIVQYHEAAKNILGPDLVYYVEVNKVMKSIPVREANVPLVRAASKKGDHPELVRLLIM